MSPGGASHGECDECPLGLSHTLALPLRAPPSPSPRPPTPPPSVLFHQEGWACPVPRRGFLSSSAGQGHPEPCPLGLFLVCSAPAQCLLSILPFKPGQGPAAGSPARPAPRHASGSLGVRGGSPTSERTAPVCLPSSQVNRLQGDTCCPQVTELRSPKAEVTSKFKSFSLRAKAVFTYLFTQNDQMASGR